MKATYKFILAAFAATVALASCTKEIAADKQDTDPQDGLRKIAVSFGVSTKTYLGEDGLTPKFEVDDEILISDGKTEPKIVKVQKKGEEAFFETNLKGNLKAVYPAEAAVFNQKTGDLSVKISSKQFGLFKDANIAIGTLNGDTMTFRNETAVLKFYVGPEIDVTMLKIHAVDTVSFDWQLSSEGNEIWVECSGIPDSVRVCYVAVNPMDNPVMLEVQSFTTTQTKLPSDPVTRIFSSVFLSKSDMVNVFIPYFIDVNGQKWGYCNVGAFLPEEPGLYFAWGDLDGARYLPSESGQPSPFFGDNGPRWFNWKECPFNGGESVFSQTAFDNDRSAALENGILKPDYDAAYYAWGEGWRMPTKGEFEILKGNSTYDPNSGKEIPFTAGLLLLPITGYACYDDVNDKAILNWGNAGVYWSSSLDENNFENAYYFSFADNTGSDFYNFGRNNGLPIRPIYITGLTVESYQKGKDL